MNNELINKLFDYIVDFCESNKTFVEPYDVFLIMNSKDKRVYNHEANVAYRSLTEDEQCVLEYKVILLSRELQRINEFKNFVRDSSREFEYANRLNRPVNEIYIDKLVYNLKYQDDSRVDNDADLVKYYHELISR